MTIKIDGKKADSIGGVSFTTNDDANGEEMAFSSLDRYKNGAKVKVTDAGATRFEGIIRRLTDGEKPPYSYTAIDFSTNLNGDCLIQFNKTRADEAIKQLLKKYGIKCTVCSMPTKISKIYNDTIINVIKNIMSLAKKDQGKSFYMEVRGTKVVVEEKKKKKISPTFEVLGDYTIDRSIEALKNEVVYISTGENSMKVLAKEGDKASQKAYGLLQQNVEADDKMTKAKAKAEAATMLKKLNKQTSTTSLTLLVTKGAWTIRKNRAIRIKTGKLNGWFTIQSCTHEVQGDRHLCTVELEW